MRAGYRIIMGCTIWLGAFVAASLARPLAAQETQVSDSLPTLAVILERYIDAVGGRAAIERLDTRIVVGREIDDRPYTGPVRVTELGAVAAYPDHWLMTFIGEEAVERRGCEGRTVWRSDESGFRPTTDPVRDKTSFLLDPRGPIRLAEYFPGMRVVGREIRRGRDVYVVHNDLDPTYYALAFDVERALLVQMGWYWTLEDYREVDGILVPARIAMSRKGGSTTYLFDEVRHNEPVPMSVFTGPTP